MCRKCRISISKKEAEILTAYDTNDINSGGLQQPTFPNGQVKQTNLKEK